MTSILIALSYVVSVLLVAGVGYSLLWHYGGINPPRRGR